MSFFPLSPLKGEVPLSNSACPWASSAEDLKALYLHRSTSFLTTRTATLHGFADDASKHQVTFFGGPGGPSSANSFGYSPFPLDTYLSWIRPLLASSAPRKQVIISITGSLDEMKEMLVVLQAFATETGATIGVEFNASCPNFRGHPPPAYVESELASFLSLLASHSSPTLKVGVKLPPYTYDDQFTSVLSALTSVSPSSPSAPHPIAFLTSTNTLGQGLVFSEQIVQVASARGAQGPKEDLFALPGGFGGLAGAAVHQISLGNVYRLSNLLKTSPDESLRSISLIGVGGVTDASGVERFRLAGASAVAVASALGREGVAVFDKLAGRLPKAHL